MAWLILFVAGLVEVGWAVGLKYTAGFTRLWPSLFTVAGGVVSFVLLARAAKDLPIGTAYAVWTGIGVVGTAVLGIALFHESRDWLRLACIALIVVGIAGLRVAAAR
jgi:quaternary ammonium compound-resistance protein SugE